MPGLSRRGFLLSAAGAVACAQDATFSLNIDEVNVLASVRDKQGRFVSDLTAQDFVVEEDGRAQTIRHFERQSDLPLTLGLLVDVSTSQTSLLNDERRATNKFFDQVIREDRDQAFLFRFARRVELLSYLSSSRKVLETALRRLDDKYEIDLASPQTTGKRLARFDGTALLDSILLSSDAIMKKQKGRKALVLLTDGVDTGSSTTLARAIEGAQRADTLIYSLCFSDPEYYDGEQIIGEKVLQRLSEQTGGRYFKVDESLDKAYKLIQDELRNQYSLSYVPPSGGTPYRKIHVTVRRKGLTVQARDGYYSGE